MNLNDQEMKDILFSSYKTLWYRLQKCQQELPQVYKYKSLKIHAAHYIITTGTSQKSSIISSLYSTATIEPYTYFPTRLAF